MTIREQRQDDEPVIRRALIWELVGIVVIFVAGSALHFVFAWSHEWRPIAWLAAANESTWEHMKLAFWPGLIWALVEHTFLGKRLRSFWLAKGLGLLVMTGAIPTLFYGYVAMVGCHHPIVDIMIFAVAVVAGQLLSYAVMTRASTTGLLNGLAVAVLLLMAVTFAICSYYPPEHFLFEEPQTHRYGIP